MRHYQVQNQEAGLRLDQTLAKIKPDLTRSFVQKLIKGGSVFVNNKKITKPAHRLAEGDELTVIIPSLRETGIKPEKIPLDIVYEDSDLIVVNKPAGMVCHPTDHGAHISGTLVNALLHHCKDLSGIGGERRPGLVHRLDKDTSGLMVVAKNDAAHHALAREWEARTVAKKYTALLCGHLVPKKGSIEAPLLKEPGRMKISKSKKAKYALTHYKVIKYIGEYSLAEVQIVTGRTHQIRVHFASIGHPVAGDTTYGDAHINCRLANAGLHRQFLHAAYLAFKHPTKNKVIKFKIPLPQALEAVLKKLT